MSLMMTSTRRQLTVRLWPENTPVRKCDQNIAGAPRVAKLGYSRKEPSCSPPLRSAPSDNSTNDTRSLWFSGSEDRAISQLGTHPSQMRLCQLLILSLVLRPHAFSKISAQLEAGLRDIFEKLPKLYEDRYLAVDDCAEVKAEDLFVYGMPNALTMAANDGVNCAPADAPVRCLVQGGVKWLRVLNRTDGEETFLENGDVAVRFHVLAESPYLQLDSKFTQDVIKLFRVWRGAGLAQEAAALECARMKFVNYMGLLEEALQEIHVQ